MTIPLCITKVKKVTESLCSIFICIFNFLKKSIIFLYVLLLFKILLLFFFYIFLRLGGYCTPYGVVYIIDYFIELNYYVYMDIL